MKTGKVEDVVVVVVIVGGRLRVFMKDETIEGGEEFDGEESTFRCNRRRYVSLLLIPISFYI